MQQNEQNRSTHVLIVDDEPFNLDLLEFSLETLENLSLIRANSAKEALSILDKHPVDLIISDIFMPGIDGLEMLKILKADKKYRYVPTIMVTAKAEERHEALELGSEDFLLKPIDPLELKFKVTNFLKLKKFNDLQQHFNQKLEEEITKKETQLKAYAHMEQELKIAKRIQDSILPQDYSKVADLDIYGQCRQATDVGGDYFDIFQTDSGRHTVIILADVSGHGIASALIAMQFRTLVHTLLYNSENNFATAIERINTIFSRDNADTSMYVTALFLRFDHHTKTFESINAGHYDPIGNVEMIHKRGIPIGIMPDVTYEVLHTSFSKGDKVLLFTDGILESENKEGIMYKEQFYESYKVSEHFSAKAQVDYLFKAFHTFITEQPDDVTLLSVQAH